MKRMGVLVLAALAAVYVSQARADEKRERGEEKGADDVKKVDRELTEAILKGDGKTFDQLTSDEYVLTSSTGRLWDKKKNLEALEDKALTFDKIDDSDVKVHMYSNTAVVTGLANIKGKSKDRAFDDKYRWTRVYVHHESGWRCVTEQLSRVWTDEEREKATGKDKEKSKDK